MIDKTDMDCMDSIRGCDSIHISWTNGKMTGHLKSVDHEFIVDVSEAFARMCGRRENKRTNRNETL